MTTETSAPKPLLAVKYPFVTKEGHEFNDVEVLLTDLGQQTGGYYLLGANNCWHGGIHITDEKFAHHKDTHPVRCMMDGTVIAYRLNKTYPTQKWQAKSTLPAVDLKLSNGFCLIQHDYESPVNQTDGDNKGKTNKLTFYSLYMHLADYNTYVADNATTEQTVAITKNTNARDTANIHHTLGVLTSSSTVKIDCQQQPYKAKVKGNTYDYYQCTVVSKATHSADAITVGSKIYLYANCFPAGTFSTAKTPPFPSYWKATVTGKSKEPMAVYSTEQACKEHQKNAIARLNPEQTVTFHSEQITTTINGKSLKMALCEFPATSTFGRGPETNLKNGWMIVDESQVSWEKVEPSDFDQIVKLSKPLPISAGDPIGLMGIWESPDDPIATGTTKTKYQMHVELFTTDNKATLDQFLNNDAKLTNGKKYLKVPKGTPLYASNGHGNYVYVHDSLFAARDYLFAESDCPQMKDTVGTLFYQLKQIRTGEAAQGPVDDFYVKIDDNVKLVTQYDWKELGFNTLEETNNDADGYINPEKITSTLFNDIFKQIDGINSRNGQGDGVLTGKEIQSALQQDKDRRNDLYKMIAGHPSEWHSATQNNIKKMYETIKAENTEEEYKNAIQFEIDRFLKCEFASQIEGLTQKLWHFHPIIAVNNVGKKDYIDRHPVVKCTRRKIGPNRYIYGPLVTGTLTINSSELEIYWNELISSGNVTEQEKNIISKMSKNEGNIDAVQSWDSELVTAGAMQKTVPLNSTSGELNIQLNEFKISNPDEFDMFFSSKGWNIDSDKVYYQSDLFFEGKKLEGIELQNALRSMCTSGNVFKIIDCEPIYHLSNAISQPVFIKKQLNDFVKRLRLVSGLNINGYSLSQILKSDFGLAVALDHHINRPVNVISYIKSSITKLHERNSNISSEISEWGSQHAVNEAALLEIYGSGRTDMTDGEKRFNNLKLEFGV